LLIFVLFHELFPHPQVIISIDFLLGLRGATPYAEFEGAQPSYPKAIKKAKLCFAFGMPLALTAIGGVLAQAKLAFRRV
jgi:hypothetical protein